METETHTCSCAVCAGKAFTAPAGLLANMTPRQRVEATHTYAQYAHGASPLAAAMRTRAGVAPA